MWFYIQINFGLLAHYTNQDEFALFNLFNSVGSYVFKSYAGCHKFFEYVTTQVLLSFGKYIIENHYQNSFRNSFIIHRASVVYDNYATRNQFYKMFNLNPSLPCLDVEDSLKEVQDASPVAVSAVDQVLL